MRKRLGIFLAIFGFVFLVGLNNSLARTESSNYIIWADVFSAGGLDADSSTNYKLQDTLGEALILSATSTSASYGVKAGFRELYADQFLTFTSGATSVNLGTLSTSAVSSASHTLTIDTNAVNGFTITVSGNTLTSGSNTIDGIGATAAASAVSTEQFGINLVANTTPSIGADPSGTAPIGSAAGQYGTANSFAFNSGDTIASASTDPNETVLTVSYIANISTASIFGTYTTTLTYAATANY